MRLLGWGGDGKLSSKWWSRSEALLKGPEELENVPAPGELSLSSLGILLLKGPEKLEKVPEHDNLK